MLASLLVCALLAPSCPQGSDAQLCEFLGQRLLGMADAAGVPALANDARATGEQRLLARLEGLHARVDLGLIEIWLPRVGCDGRGEPAQFTYPRIWIELAESVLAIQGSWSARLAAGSPKSAGKSAVAVLERWTRKAGVNLKLPQPAPVQDAAVALRTQLAAPKDMRMYLVLAPTRAQYLALIGASGVQIPKYQKILWQSAIGRSGNTYIASRALAIALTGGPQSDAESVVSDRELEHQSVVQGGAHAGSHLVSSALIPGAPLWFTEGVALLDCVGAVGADETLCAGYSGRKALAEDSLSNTAGGILFYTRIESSPYRTGGSSDLFVDELRKARVSDGFRILDLDTSREGLVIAGPFLGEDVRVPGAIDSGPRGLKEGYAEFFRAYCGAFAAFLNEQVIDKGNLLDCTLSEMQRRSAAGPGGNAASLTVVLRELTGKGLGASLDPEQDLEGAFDAWLKARR
jgi:hypothetical protein